MRIQKSDITNIINRSSDVQRFIRSVEPIVNDVKTKGDEAIIEYTKKLDGISLDRLEVTGDELRELSELVDEKIKHYIDVSMDSVRSLYELMKPVNAVNVHNGVERSIKWIPLDRVGIYVPKGYFSTLIMTSTIARIAGVGEIVISTPPNKDGSITPEVAYVALKLGARVYRVGGAQAIAAMAFGTRTIPKVDKIIGPGNSYVQAAKLLVSQYVGIDGFEGPTELVVCVSPGWDVNMVSLDLAAQLEHNSALGVVMSWDDDYLKKIENKVKELTNAPYYSLLVSDADECVELVNQLSPEHVSLWGLENYRDRIRNAGAVSVNTPSALIDYVAGPSHVLPTSGSARWRGVLSVFDFMKPLASVRIIDEIAARGMLVAGAELAMREGFRLHSNSIREVMS